MAMVEISRALSGIRYPVFTMSRERSEIVEEIQVVPETTPSPGFKEDIIFVALGKYEKENETILMWALRNSEGKRLCILHVHQPAQKIPTPLGKFPISQMEKHQVEAYHENERHEMHKILDKYVRTCGGAGAQAEKLCVEMDSIEKGIVKLISEHGIKWLVMGTVSYSRKTKEPKSKKAIYVRRQAPVFCNIWFVCKGNLIQTRESKSGGINVEAESLSFQASPNSETVIQSVRSRSIAAGELAQINPRHSPPLFYRRVRSDNHAMQCLAVTNIPGRVTPPSLSTEEDSDVDRLSGTSPSLGSHFSTCSSSDRNEDLGVVMRPMNEESETCFEPPMIQQNDTIDGNPHDQLYDRLEQFVAEAASSRREVYEESMRRKKAEKEVIDVIRRAKASEIMYNEEVRRRKQIEAALKCQLDKILEELRVSQEQKSLMERQIADSDEMVEELKQKMFSAVELLQKYKKERDELQVECENALSVAEELRKKQADLSSSSSVSQLFSEFSFSEIEEATNNFSEDLKIGEGGYGRIYRGHLRHTQVAIKIRSPGSQQGPVEFRQEVNILSTMRHPNLVTLIGACPEAWALIYEYLPNGSLEDRLNCKDNTPPLSWQTRIRIAAELCSALIFLHSCRPQGIVHGDLKPSNILLDVNFVTKIGDFGTSRILSLEHSENNTTRSCKTELKGTTPYIDPEFRTTGELTSRSDVYAFGIILLRLLTGRSALRISRDVQYALDKGNLNLLLDPSAGDWPFIQAEQLAHLALRCSDLNGRNRPGLASESWRVLESMRASCGILPARFGVDKHSEVPSYFVCPIFQEIMQDPVVAADGFTYEAEAIKGWLDSNHDTSPMTNLKLANHNLVPNYALRSAIKQLLQQP